MKASVILPVLGALVLIGIASITFTNDRITTTQETHKQDVVRIEETQKEYIRFESVQRSLDRERLAVVETKIDNVQRTVDRIERVLNRSSGTNEPEEE